MVRSRCLYHRDGIQLKFDGLMMTTRGSYQKYEDVGKKMQWGGRSQMHVAKIFSTGNANRISMAVRSCQAKTRCVRGVDECRLSIM
jgi:hypothetical protein